LSVTTSIPPSPTANRVSARAWLVVALLFVVGLLNYLDRIMITTMRTSIREAIPMTDAEFGLLTSVFLWIYGLLSPFAGYLADRYSRSRVIIISLFVWSLITWLTIHVTTFEELLLTRALMGISEACYIPAAMALIADYHRGSTRSLATGIHLAGIMTGQSLGFIGGWLAEEHSWTYSFSVIGIVGIVYAALLLFFLKDTTRQVVVKNEALVDKVSFFAGIKDLFRRRQFILLLLFWSFLGIVGWLIFGWLPVFYKESFHLSQSEAGLYATGYLHPVSLVGVLLGGFLADRWSKINPRARILLPAIGLCIAAPFVFTASVTSILPLAVFGFMMYGLCRASSDSNLMPILCMIADARYRATGYGVLNLFACIIGGIGLYAGGALRDANVNFSRLFQFASVIMVVCALILFSVRPKVEK
jgi:MFS family permease